MTKKIRTFWNERWEYIITKHPTRSCAYQISNYGRIKSIHKETGKETLLKGNLTRNLRTINLKLKDKQYQSVYIHRFVAEHFLHKPSEAHDYIIHLDKDRLNNFFKNLKWATKEEWMQHHEEMGTFKLENKKRAKTIKMTETKVAILKQRLKKGKTKRSILARDFNITETQLRRIERGENWGHVKAREA